MNASCAQYATTACELPQTGFNVVDAIAVATALLALGLFGWARSR